MNVNLSCDRAISMINQIIPELQVIGSAARALQAREAAVTETETKLNLLADEIAGRAKKIIDREQAADSLKTALSNARTQIKAGEDRETKQAEKLTEARKERDAYKARLFAIEAAFPQLAKLEAAPTADVVA